MERSNKEELRVLSLVYPQHRWYKSSVPVPCEVLSNFVGQYEVCCTIVPIILG